MQTTKTLGVLWSATDGNFFFGTPVLKKTATVYDPPGILSPYIIRSKFLMQKTWLETGAWDDSFPIHHQHEWIKWFRELNDLEFVKIPRCLKEPKKRTKKSNKVFKMVSGEI